MTPQNPCPTCGKSFRYSIADSYRYAESGLANVYLQNVETVSCGCGESLVIRALPTLLRIIAMCMAHKPARLRGQELRFIRQVLSKKAKDFARNLSVTPEHLSRIEQSNDSLSPTLDKLVRSILVLELTSEHPALSRHFDLKRFLALSEQKLPADDASLGLFVKYRGPYLGADDETELEFEFKEAA